jgi:hypothetical protein
MADSDWPEHWMSRAASETARIIYISTQPFHQVSVAEDDEHTLKMMGELGYRLWLIIGDSQHPQQNRRRIYRKAAPEQEPDGRPRSEEAEDHHRGQLEPHTEGTDPAHGAG